MQSFKKYISESPELDEGKGKPGLWANIHAKRKRGERPAKPGEEGYPKTLDIEESGKGYQPGWMLKKDPELAKKLKDKIDLAKKRQASYGNPAAGKSVKENKDEHDINSLQKHFGPAVAYDAASHGPAMMKRKDISGKSHTLIKQSNGKYKSVKEDVEQLDEVKVGDVLIAGGKNITAGIVKKIEGDSVIVHHRPSNTLHRVSKKSISPSNIVKEEVELNEVNIVTVTGSRDIRPGTKHSHTIVKDHGVHDHETGAQHKVFTVKRPNGFHGVLVTNKDNSHVVGQTHGNHSKEEALKIANHYVKHGQVGMSKHAPWYVGGDKIVKEEVELKQSQGVAESEAPLKHHNARVSYHKEGDPHRRYEAIFKTTHNGGKEETEKRAKAAFAAKKKIVYDIVHEQGVAEELDTLSQIDELSKETLGSYKHKAELSIPKDDREYKNRSKGIDYAEKKLKKEETQGIALSKAYKKDFDGKKPGHNRPEIALTAAYSKTGKAGGELKKKLKKESVELDEMTQGKSYTQDQLRKKMQSGNWEATHDIKPGKHVEMRHHTGKRVMVHVKESIEQLDELSPNLLHRYIKKSSDDMGMHAVDHGKYGDQQKDKKSLNKAIKRSDGIVSASGRLADKANRNESEINDITAQYINENNITLEELENMTEAELNELIGKAIGGAFKLGAKAAVGATRLAGKAINRMSTSGRADAAEKKASTLEKKNADRERIRAAQDRLRKAKEAASKR